MRSAVPSRRTDCLLDEGKASLAALASVWGGTGSDAYQAVQTRWDTTSAELNSALLNLAHTISDAGQTWHRPKPASPECSARSTVRAGGRARPGGHPPTACVSTCSIRTIERYSCRPTMTGFSTLQAMLCRPPTTTRIATPSPQARMPTAVPGRSEVTPPPMPIAAEHNTQVASAPPPRQTEVTTQMPPTRSAPPQRQQPNGMMRTPKSTGPAGARFEQQRSAPTPQPRPAPAPAPSQHSPRRNPEKDVPPAGGPARADVGGDDRQSPRHRRAVARRCAVRGQDAVAARLAALCSTC